jgi:2-hydroxychromene-2-carboxylate isomerase
MAAPIEFWFDFSSPFGYLASTRIETLAAKYKRETIWRPFLLGAVYKVNGVVPTPNVPLKGDYARIDILRSGRFYGIPIKVPAAFPINSVGAARAFYWADAQDAAKAKQLAAALYKAYFVDDLDISNAENVVKVAVQCGFDAAAVAAGMADQAVKDRTKQEVDAAIAKSVFGSPYIIIDGEPFWGMDRMDQAEKWLASGPF